ncbi:hypothetical protein M426DRAFT_214185 [Hypoxylon sp. CI-4A]|nr:hypothetical protein M426DRAFT_214185 [Hypoxylon sp. CI-4A]
MSSSRLRRVSSAATVLASPSASANDCSVSSSEPDSSSSATMVLSLSPSLAWVRVKASSRSFSRLCAFSFSAFISSSPLARKSSRGSSLSLGVGGSFDWPEEEDEEGGERVPGHEGHEAAVASG